MSVQAVRLKNFMAFQDTDWIELRPITLLCGKNSSGKSVIGRTLRLLKQSLGAEAGSGPFVYAARRGVDVGDFGTMIHTSPSSPDWPKPVVFAFRCQLRDTLDPLTRLVNQQRRREGLSAIPASQAQDQVELWLQYEWDDELEQARLTELEITYPQSPTEQQPRLIVFAAYRLDYHVATEGQDEWWFHSDILHGHEIDTDSAWAGARIELVSGFLPTLAMPEPMLESKAASSDDVRFVVTLLGELRQTVVLFLQRTDYLGPLRPEPEREFVFDAERLSDWQGSGLRGYLRYLRGDVNESVIEEVNRWLQAVDLCHRARPVTFHSFGDRALFAYVDIYESAKADPRNLADVGFGLSQVLPLIIQCLVSDSDSTLLIEQPELHLHPDAQAALTDLFIARASQAGRAWRLIQERKERGEPEPIPQPTQEEIDSLQVQFLIETHSKHFPLRLRRRIVETAAGKLDGELDGPKQIHPDEMVIYFVDRLFEQSNIQEITVDRKGDFEYIPGGFRDFYASDMEDIVMLSKASREIRPSVG